MQRDAMVIRIDRTFIGGLSVCRADLEGLDENRQNLARGKSLFWSVECDAKAVDLSDCFDSLPYN